MAVIFWILNDSYFKYIFHNDLTGKISDIIGLFYTPILFTALIVTFFQHKKYQIKESKILFVTMAFVAIMFISLNLNQETNDLLVKNLWFFIPSKGTADQTDLYCLLIYIPLVFIFYNLQKNHSQKQFKVLKYLTPLFLSFAIINTSSIGNSETDLERISYFMLLADTSDKIISISPEDGETFQKSQNINFEWSYKNYYGVTEPSIYDKEMECGVTGNLNELNGYIAGKFQNYVVQIANNETFSPIGIEFNSNGIEKRTNGSINSSGSYYYRIALHYKNKSECTDPNFLIFLPQQNKKIVIRD
ncbi:hypothetical protein EHQ30_03865 [Leptospira brenneri]|uniref:Uncharacterized protein n=1 Tax=Leptospira brenneri TaxID=2023182 RepID=A0A5F1ZAR6_9LEPT|nr:hypothetical protein [Leptospira brenneri]TGK95777.1 hypothetical protein EHQ30_03865 [Leptospira brenneri]